jgi:hypothetical protein
MEVILFPVPVLIMAPAILPSQREGIPGLDAPLPPTAVLELLVFVMGGVAMARWVMAKRNKSKRTTLSTQEVGFCWYL